MNCLLTSEIYYFSLLLATVILASGDIWWMFVFLWLHSHNLFLPSPYISKKVQVENKELKASHPLCWGLTEERCKLSPVGCWLSHKNLRLLISTLEGKKKKKREIIVLFMSLVTSMSSPTSMSQFWTDFLIWQVSVKEDLCSLHKPKDIMPPNTSILF